VQYCSCGGADGAVKQTLYHCATVKAGFHINPRPGSGLQLSPVATHKAKRATLPLECRQSATVGLPLLAVVCCSCVHFCLFAGGNAPTDDAESCIIPKHR
jgi:hypothetical protein